MTTVESKIELDDPGQLADWVASARNRNQAASDLPQLLIRESGRDAAAIAHVLADCMGYRCVSIDQFRDAAPLFDDISYTEALKRRILALHVSSVAIPVLVTANPLDSETMAWAENRMSQATETWVTTEDDLLAYLSIKEASLRATPGALGDLPDASLAGEDAEVLSLSSIAADASPAVKLVNSTLFDALRENASDVHLEMLPGGMAIKYRIDGVLVAMGVANGYTLGEQAVSRIKVMAELDIAEKRVPQDGRLKVRYGDRDIDVRVSVMPSTIGEDVVLRILDRRGFNDDARSIDLADLGFDAAAIRSIRKLAREPYGMLLVTGPTGSGKTTTLYAALAEINTGQDKIVTIEDPVEYKVPGILQIPVNEKKGLTFARGLRSILRHDPDKILVGEIRDPETAQIAIQSALTGHLVLTSVHANNTFDVIGRLMHMGLDPYSFVSALNGVVAQRLLRINCTACLRSDAPTREAMQESGLSEEMAATFDFKRGMGCGQCRGSGYRGRKAIAEILRLDDNMREIIANRRAVRELKEAAAKAGMQTLRDAALRLVKHGETTLEEANRVTFVA